MDRLDSISVLHKVIDAGSLSAAGRALNMPLATVSRRISELEAHLGTQLLIRSSRHMEMTEAGRAYVIATRRIMEDLTEAERHAAGEYKTPKGELVLTAPLVFGRMHLLPVVSEFLLAYPEISVKIGLSDRPGNLIDDHIDLALRIGPLPDSDLKAIKLGTVRRMLCASPAYFARNERPTSLGDLSGHEGITYETLSAEQGWRFGPARDPVFVRVPSRLSVNSAEAAIDAAIAGIGLTQVLSYQIAAPLREGTLLSALEPFEPEPWPVHLLYVAQGLVPLKVRAFIDFAAPRLKAKLL